MVMKCDLCEGRLIMQSGGKSAVCADCGMEYSFERLKEKIAEARDATKKEKQDALPSSETDREVKVPAEPEKTEPVVYEAAWEDEPAEEEPTVYEAQWEDDSAEEPAVYEAEWEDDSAEEEPTIYEAEWEDEPEEQKPEVPLTQVSKEAQYVHYCKNCRKIIYCGAEYVHIPYCEDCIPIIQQQYPKMVKCKKCKTLIPEYVNRGFKLCIDCMNQEIYSGNIVKRDSTCTHCGAESARYVYSTAPGAYINCPSCGKRYSAYYTKYRR